MKSRAAISAQGRRTVSGWPPGKPTSAVYTPEVGPGYHRPVADAERPDTPKVVTVAGWRRVSWTSVFAFMTLSWAAFAVLVHGAVLNHAFCGLAAVAFALPLWRVAMKGEVEDDDDRLNRRLSGRPLDAGGRASLASACQWAVRPAAATAASALSVHPSGFLAPAFFTPRAPPGAPLDLRLL